MAKGQQQEVTPTDAYQIGPDLYVTTVNIASLREQDINAQIMQPRQFDRLTENIKIRGQLESFPYCNQPDATGTISIISGHHRARAARAAGLTNIPIILDTRTMRTGEITAKQIAHNELHGEVDDAILQQLLATITDVDDMLMTGLDESQLPSMDPDDTDLHVPSADFDWRMVTMMFLPSQLPAFEQAVSVIERKSELIGVANEDQFKDFAQACLDYGRTRNIRSMATTVATLVSLAQREVEAAGDERRGVNADLIGLARYTEVDAARIRLAVEKAQAGDPELSADAVVAQWAADSLA